MLSLPHNFMGIEEQGRMECSTIRVTKGTIGKSRISSEGNNIDFCFYTVSATYWISSSPCPFLTSPMYLIIRLQSRAQTKCNVFNDVQYLFTGSLFKQYSKLNSGRFLLPSPSCPILCFSKQTTSTCFSKSIQAAEKLELSFLPLWGSI